jgi:hypothetical protein
VLSKAALVRARFLLLPVLSKGEWLLFGAPLTVAVSILVSIGPTLQPYIFSLAETRAPSVYEAAHKSSIVQFSGFSHWIGIAFFPLYVAWAIVISFTTLRKRKTYSFAMTMAVSSFTTLTATDLIGSLITGETDVKLYFINIIANLLAGGFFFVFGSVSVFLRQTVASASLSTSRWLLPLSITGLSIGVSAACYFLLTWVYQPTLVRFDASFSAPSEGYFVPKTHSRELPDADPNEEETDYYFSFIPENTEVSSVEITSPRGRTVTRFHVDSSRILYDLEATLLANCLRDAEKRPKRVASQAARLEGIRTASIAFDAGFSEVVTTQKSTVSLHQEQPTLFWLNQGEKPTGKVNKVEFYVNPKDQVSSHSSDGFEFITSAYLLNVSGKAAVRGPRTLTIATERRKLSIVLAPGPVSNSARMAECAPVAHDQFQEAFRSPSSKSTIQLPPNVIGASVLIRIKPHGTPADGFDATSESLDFTGANGWLTAQKPELKSGTSSLGTTRLISFEGSESKIEVDGRPIDIPLGEAVNAGGALSGRVTLDGRVFLTGQADALWRGSNRLNPTRWERMPTELQALMLSFLGLIIVALVRWYRPIWKKTTANHTLTPM